VKLREIYNKLDEISPFEMQESWDNSGLIVGDMDREITKVIVSLDIDEAMIDEADEGSLFVVHHPLIFGGLKSLDFDRYPSNLLEKMIQKRQSCIAMHTNFDKTHLNRYVFEKVLGFELESERDFVCYAKGNWESEEILKTIKSKLQLPYLKVVGNKEKIETIAMTTGSGASLIDEIDADCFLTGDIKYHDAMKANAQGLMMVDIGHYESERYFSDIMQSLLENLGILAIIIQSKNPFQTIDL